jgi:hypothetical protein
MPAMLDGPGTALVTRTKWVRVPPPALNDPVVERRGGDLQNRMTWVRLPPGSLAHSGAAQAVRAPRRRRGGRWLEPCRRNSWTGLASDPAHRSWALGKGVRRPRSGSIPVLSALLYCPVAQRWCGWLLTRRLQVRALPGQLDTEGRANRHDGTHLESGRGESPCRFESCPFR